MLAGNASAHAIDKWVRTSLADLTETDVFIIVGTTSDGASFGMTNNGGTGSAPRTADVTVVGDEITKGAVNDDIKWNISGNATDGYVFYPAGQKETWLYCTNTNNGVRIGTVEDKTFTVSEEGYLVHAATNRYIGIYNSQDWRCYTSINNNIKDQNFSYFKKVTVDTPETQVATPVITGEEYFYPSTEITITCETENAEIWYVLSNGIDEPTTHHYDGPFTITETMLVQASATKEGMDNSESVKMTFSKIEPLPNIVSIPGAVIHDYVQLTDALVTYKNGKYAYLEDYSGAILLYDCAGDLEVGDKLTGMMHITDYTVYNKLPEIKAFEMMEGYTKTSGNEVIPTEITLEQLLLQIASDPYERKLSKFIKIVDANVTSAFANKNCTITQGDYSIILRDQNSQATLTSTEGDIVTVTGHVAIFNDTKQIAVYEQSQIEVKPAPSIPTILETRAQTSGTEVSTQGIVTSCTVGPVKAQAFIQDETAAICVYAPAEDANLLTVGNKINIQGTLKYFRNNLEIQDPTITVVSTGNALPTPEVITINNIWTDWESNDITHVKQGKLVKIENATVIRKIVSTTSTLTNAEIQQDTRTLYIQGIPEDVQYEENDRLTFVGNLAANTDVQIFNPTNFEVTPAGTPDAGDFTWDLSSLSYTVNAEGDVVTWSSLFAAMVNTSQSGGTKANNYLGGDRNQRTSSRFYTNNTLTITPTAGSIITKIEFTATSEAYANALQGSTWTNATVEAEGTTVTVTPVNGAAVVTAVIGGTCGFTAVKVYYQQVETVNVEVSAAGYATFVTPKPVDFTGVTAYVVSAINTVTVTLTEVTEAPANTPVIIKADEGSYPLIVKESAAEVGANLLKVSDGTIVGGDGIFVLAKPEGKEAGFYAVKTGSFIAKGKAYIDVINADVKVFYFNFDNETAIETIAVEKETINEGIYNLSGQRVNKAQKGIYIINGKKVLR